MKTILFIRNPLKEEDIEKIKLAFMETRVEYEIILDRNCIIINGRNDIVRAAKILLTEAGYIVE